MTYDKAQLLKALASEQFPKSAKYDPEWLCENEMGPCSVWLTEFLTQDMSLKPGMKVLDMGCGKAMSSIFLAREFGVTVFANDLWISAADNWQRIRAAGVEDLVFPMHAEAHALPYADEFFDAIVSADSYHYYGTDDLYLPGFIRFLRHGGQIGIVVPGLGREFGQMAPESLKPFWEADMYAFHSPGWWRKLWERSEAADIEIADSMPNGFEVWHHWEKTLKDFRVSHRNCDVKLLEADGGEYLGFSRIIARRK